MTAFPSRRDLTSLPSDWLHHMSAPNIWSLLRKRDVDGLSTLLASGSIDVNEAGAGEQIGHHAYAVEREEAVIGARELHAVEPRHKR